MQSTPEKIDILEKNISILKNLSRKIIFNADEPSGLKEMAAEVLLSLRNSLEQVNYGERYVELEIQDKLNFLEMINKTFPEAAEAADFTTLTEYILEFKNNLIKLKNSLEKETIISQSHITPRTVSSTQARTTTEMCTHSRIDPKSIFNTRDFSIGMNNELVSELNISADIREEFAKARYKSYGFNRHTDFENYLRDFSVTWIDSEILYNIKNEVITLVIPPNLRKVEILSELIIRLNREKPIVKLDTNAHFIQLDTKESQTISRVIKLIDGLLKYELKHPLAVETGLILTPQDDGSFVIRSTEVRGRKKYSVTASIPDSKSSPRVVITKFDPSGDFSYLTENPSPDKTVTFTFFSAEQCEKAKSNETLKVYKESGILREGGIEDEPKFTIPHTLVSEISPFLTGIRNTVITEIKTYR